MQSDWPAPSFSVQGAISGLVGQLLLQGVNRDRIEPYLRVDGGLVAERLPLQQWVSLWDFAIKTLGAPALVASLPMANQSRDKHHLVHLLLTSSTLMRGLHVWCQYAALLGMADRVQLTLEGDLAHLSYECLDLRYDAAYPSIYTLALLWGLILLVTNTRTIPRGIGFSQSEPKHFSDLEKVFNSPITFSARKNSVSFDARLLQAQASTRDDYLHQLLLMSADTALQGLLDKQSIIMKVAYAIGARLLDHLNVTSDFIAQDLGIAPRRLRALLSKENVSCQQVLDEIRKKAVLRYLIQGMSTLHMAERLGFSESSALQHAFTRWHGMSVGAYKKKLVDADKTA